MVPKVHSPMKGWPCYALPEGASTDEIRARMERSLRGEMTVAR